MRCFSLCHLSRSCVCQPSAPFSKGARGEVKSNHFSTLSLGWLMYLFLRLCPLNPAFWTVLASVSLYNWPSCWEQHICRATHTFPTKLCLFSSKQGFQLTKRTRILYFSHSWHMPHTILIKYCFRFLSMFLCTCALSWWSRRYKKQVFLNREIIKGSSNAICRSVCIQVFDLIMLKGGDIGQSEWRL